MTRKEQQSAKHAWELELGARAKALAQQIAGADKAPAPNPRSLLALEAPDLLRCGHSTATVGATVYRALAALLAGNGRMSRGKFCRAVWGEDRVKDATLWSICHRVSQKLKQAGSPMRVGVDLGEVVLA